jgi:hypothetical protein
MLCDVFEDHPSFVCDFLDGVSLVRLCEARGRRGRRALASWTHDLYCRDYVKDLIAQRSACRNLQAALTLLAGDKCFQVLGIRYFKWAPKDVWQVYWYLKVIDVLIECAVEGVFARTGPKFVLNNKHSPFSRKHATSFVGDVGFPDITCWSVRDSLKSVQFEVALDRAVEVRTLLNGRRRYEEAPRYSISSCGPRGGVLNDCCRGEALAQSSAVVAPSNLYW